MAPSRSTSTPGVPRAGEGKLAGLRVALVFPVFIDHELASYQENARYLGSIPPISLGYVASALEAGGAEVLLLDCPTLGMRMDRAIEVVRAFRPDYVGFTLATVDWMSSLTWMRGFHAALGVPIVVGGIHMECYPAETMTHECITLGFVGHADRGVIELLATHQSGGDLRKVPGACFRDADGEVVLVPEGKRPRTDEGMPLPARHLWPTDKHFSIVSTESHFTAAMSNFGILRGDALRQRSAMSVVDEMETCHRDFGIWEMDFFDPVFTMRRDRVFAICDEIKRRGLDRMVWSIRARTDAMDEAMLDALWSAGCRRIFYGIESGSNEILKRVDKRQTSTEHIRHIVVETKRRGFEVLAFVMIGNPLETRRTVGMTRRMLKELPIDLIQVASLFPLPKTPIYEELVRLGGRDPWREHVLHGTPFPTQRLDTTLDDETIRSLVTQTYMSFYFRPTFAKFALGRIKQPAQLKRGLDAALGLARTFLASPAA